VSLRQPPLQLTGRPDNLQPEARLRVGPEDLPRGREQGLGGAPLAAAGKSTGVGEPEQAVGRALSREGREIRRIIPIADRAGPADAGGIARAQVLDDWVRDSHYRRGSTGHGSFHPRLDGAAEMAAAQAGNRRLEQPAIAQIGHPGDVATACQPSGNEVRRLRRGAAEDQLRPARGDQLPAQPHSGRNPAGLRVRDHPTIPQPAQETAAGDSGDANLLFGRDAGDLAAPQWAEQAVHQVVRTVHVPFGVVRLASVAPRRQDDRVVAELRQVLAELEHALCPRGPDRRVIVDDDQHAAFAHRVETPSVCSSAATTWSCR